MQSVRVRFAPSPTGYIHLGGLRTALYNFMFAKSHKGKFVLRIEDTDQKRLVPGAAEQLERDLDWMGLTPDESPMKGGGFGPYSQSERLLIYQHFVQELETEGHAYPCFCTNKRLELVKKQAVREGNIPKYDNRCRHLPSAVIEEKKRQGIPYCIRFKLSPLDDCPKDIIYGNVDCNAVLHEGDPVILKQDRFPTYHLANVVDDHLMEITHVMRGTEWLVSTPKHILLYKAFKWTPPKFAHLPLIMNPDGTKLSKRQDDIRLEYFRTKGFYPEAIAGLLCLVGGGFPAADIQQKLSSLSELSQKFQLESINTHSGRLDMLRLEHFNRLALIKQLNQAEIDEELVANLADIVRRSITKSILDEDMLKKESLVKILQWATAEGRVYLLENLVQPDMKFLWTQPQNDLSIRIPSGQAKSVLNLVVDWLKEQDSLNKSQAVARLREIAKESNLKLSEVMKLLRTSLTGLQEGPSIGEIVEILGPQICIRRLSNSIALLR